MEMPPPKHTLAQYCQLRHIPHPTDDETLAGASNGAARLYLPVPDFDVLVSGGGRQLQDLEGVQIDKHVLRLQDSGCQSVHAKPTSHVTHYSGCV